MLSPPVWIAIACLGLIIALFTAKHLRARNHRQRQHYDARLTAVEQRHQQRLQALEQQHREATQTVADLEQQNQALLRELTRLQAAALTPPPTLPAPASPPAAQPRSMSPDLQALEKVLEDKELERQLLLVDIAELEQKRQQLSQECQEIEQENARLEEYHYKLMSQEQAIAHCEELKAEIAELQAEIVTLQAQIEQQQTQLQQTIDHEANLRRISIVSACHRMNSEAGDLYHAQIDTRFDSVIHAVEFAEYLSGDVLEIWDSARASAYQSNFVRPHDVYRNLQALVWLGRDYFAGDGELGKPIYEYLQQLNCNYSSESDTVKNDQKLLNERKFRHSGQSEKVMLEHLKVGTGRGKNKNLRIYFALNLARQKVEIGHCGNHLTLRST